MKKKKVSGGEEVGEELLKGDRSTPEPTNAEGQEGGGSAEIESQRELEPEFITEHQAEKKPEFITEHQAEKKPEVITEHQAEKKPEFITEHQAEKKPEVITEHQAEKKGGVESIYKLPAWAELLIILGFLLISQGVGVIFKGLAEKSGSASVEFANFLGYSSAFGLTIIFAVILRLYSGYRRPVLRIGLKRSNPSIILWGVVLMLVMNVVLDPLVALFPSKYLDLLKDAVGSGGWAILTVVVAAPILEEILFRGLIQEGLTRRYGAGWAVLVSALIFGLIHVIPQQVVVAFFSGIVLGYIYIKTNSIFPVIVIHAINNGLAFIMMKVAGGKYADTSTREMINNDIIYWLVYATCVAIVVVAGVAIWRAINRNNVKANRAR